MSALHWSPQQDAFAAALLDPGAVTPEFVATRNGTAVAARFAVYRNNVHASLIDALLAAFPVTAQLVSEESFRALAREFLRTELPQAAALHDYGAGLPAFIRDYAPGATPPYLADVAALEHAWWQAYGAADAPVLSLRELATADGAALLGRRARLHPATRLIHSTHPVHGIWAAHQGEGEPAPPTSWEAECALLTRPDLAVQVRQIAPSTHAFLAALATDATLESAASAALELDPGFDLGAALLLAIEAGAIQELYPMNLARLQSIGQCVALLALRFALAVPFWRSGLTKWDGFLKLSDSTLTLFTEEFRLHIFGNEIPYPMPNVVAHLSGTAEICLPILLVLGLGTRYAAAGILMMTGIIQLTEPDGWANFHLPWAAMALTLVVFGPGRVALDTLVGKFLQSRRARRAQ